MAVAASSPTDREQKRVWDVCCAGVGADIVKSAGPQQCRTYLLHVGHVVVVVAVLNLLRVDVDGLLR